MISSHLEKDKEDSLSYTKPLTKMEDRDGRVGWMNIFILWSMTQDDLG